MCDLVVILFFYQTFCIVLKYISYSNWPSSLCKFYVFSFRGVSWSYFLSHTIDEKKPIFKSWFTMWGCIKLKFHCIYNFWQKYLDNHRSCILHCEWCQILLYIFGVKYIVLFNQIIFKLFQKMNFFCRTNLSFLFCFF